jgi:HNH endonuclease
MRRASWKEVHGELTRLALSKGAYDAEEARWLLEGKRVRVHERLGYSTFLSYLEHVFGYGPRLASERIRVAEALTRLPAMFEALARGDLHWSAVRELTRIVVPATEGEWLAEARGKTVRDVEDMVSGLKQGDRPGDPRDPKAQRHCLRFELSGDTVAAFREARRYLELEVGHSLTDDEAIRMLAHHAMSGPRDSGRAAYQIAITVCEECGRGTRDGAGRVLEIEPHMVEAAWCDAQNIGRSTHVDGQPARATQTIPPRIRRMVERRDHGRCRVDGCRSAKHLEAHHIVPRAEGGTHDPSLLAMLCDAHHTQVHRGVLRVTGNANGRLEFRRADGTRVGERPRATAPARACTAPAARQTAGPAAAASQTAAPAATARPTAAPTAATEAPAAAARQTAAPAAAARHSPRPPAAARPTATRASATRPTAAPAAATRPTATPAAATRPTAAPTAAERPVAARAPGGRQPSCTPQDEADAIDALRRLDIPAKPAREAVAAAAEAGAEDLEALLRQALQILGRTLYASVWTSAHGSRACQPTGTYRLRGAVRSSRAARSLDVVDGLGQHRALHRSDQR